MGLTYDRAEPNPPTNPSASEMETAQAITMTASLVSPPVSLSVPHSDVGLILTIVETAITFPALLNARPA